MSFLVLRDAVFLSHVTPSGHPESVERLKTIYSGLDTDPVLDARSLTCGRRAQDDELLLVHSQRVIDEVAASAEQTSWEFDADTHASPQSNDAARAAVGAVLESVDLAAGKTNERSFALVRPPGHHAERDRPMGFCLFNNVAAGAAYATARRGYSRVAIYDFDVHHGNGTQEIFFARPDILYLSHHQYPFYPGTGDWSEVGTGDGRGATLNAPLPRGAGDAEVLFLWDSVWLPVLSQFAPQILFLSAGFDAHRDDPLGQLEVTDEGFRLLFARIEAFARAKAIPLIYVLEGGYNLEALSRSVRSVLLSHTMFTPPPPAPAPTQQCLNLLTQARNAHGQYWKF